jgi:hypothetical protein
MFTLDMVVGMVVIMDLHFHMEWDGVIHIQTGDGITAGDGVTLIMDITTRGIIRITTIVAIVTDTMTGTVNRTDTALTME